MIWLVIKLLTNLQKSQKKFVQNSSETTANEYDKEIINIIWI